MTLLEELKSPHAVHTRLTTESVASIIAAIEERDELAQRLAYMTEERNRIAQQRNCMEEEVSKNGNELVRARAELREAEKRAEKAERLEVRIREIVGATGITEIEGGTRGIVTSICDFAVNRLNQCRDMEQRLAQSEAANAVLEEKLYQATYFKPTNVGWTSPEETEKP